ncbi:MAG: transcription termination factor NusA [Proteobacteria bacterium]|nr:transcription termination factor NusA [Pseudomonadota bacterium]
MNLSAVISAVSQDKNLEKSVIIDAMEQAILHVAQRHYGVDSELEVAYNNETQEIDLFQFRTVVQKVEHKDLEMTLEDALKLDESSEMGDSIGVRLDTSKFGRIAAQAAKQIIMQKVNEAERKRVYESYKDKQGEILSGYVRRVDRRSIVVDLGQVEAIIPIREQIYGERFRVKDRIQGYVIEVSDLRRGAQIIMSRACNEFLIKLFEQQVTEVYDGIVEIVAVARDPGRRAKMSVTSRDSSVDPVGACVGIKGVRVQAIVNELGGEKIDVIPWENDPAVLVCNALSPAVISKVIVDEENKSMEVVVSEDYLSLAIGRRGQNVRLAAQLTGWRLDIKSEISMEKQIEAIRTVLSTIEGLGSMHATILMNEGVKTMADLAEMPERTLIRLLNLDEDTAKDIIEKAKAKLEELLAKEEAAKGDLAEEVSASPISKKERKKQEIAQKRKEERATILSAIESVGEASVQAFAEAGYGAIGDIIADSAEEVATKTGLPISVVKSVQKIAENHMTKLQEQQEKEVKALEDVEDEEQESELSNID